MGGGATIYGAGDFGAADSGRMAPQFAPEPLAYALAPMPIPAPAPPRPAPAPRELKLVPVVDGERGLSGTGGGLLSLNFSSSAPGKNPAPHVFLLLRRRRARVLRTTRTRITMAAKTEAATIAPIAPPESPPDFAACEVPFAAACWVEL